MAYDIETFQKTVTTAGTPVKLDDVPVESDQSVVIKAKSANTGTITVGFSSASALNSSSSHFKLRANESLEDIKISNTNRIWIDATVNGEGVEVAVG